MPKNTVTIGGKIGEKMLKVKRNLGSVNYFSSPNVNTPRIMNLVEKFKNKMKNDIVVSRCFHNSAIDKKTCQALLVRGNQKKFVKHVRDPLVVKTRTFKATTNQISGENIVKCTTNNNIALCGSYNDNILGKCDNTANCADESMKQIAPKVTVV